MELVAPSIKYKDSFLAMVYEFQSDSSADRYDTIDNLSYEEIKNDFDGFVKKLEAYSRGENLSEGRVPDTKYWLVDNEEVVGQVGIRHKLNENLRKRGGHIGYGVRSGKRRQGYGSKILELAIGKTKELGIEKILVTCSDSNIGSQKIIEKNGGALTETVPDEEVGKLRKYWISLN